MASIKQTKDDALATIDAALTVADKYPKLSSVNTNSSSNNTTNPFTFLMDAFKNVAGSDKIINIISTFITTQLDNLEGSIKDAIISNIKSLISCSINPYISDDLLRDGIVFDLRQLDITELLQTCPTDPKIGKYFYFGCDEYKNVDETKNAKDFNAFLWYMKNRATKREVWGKTEDRDESESSKDTKGNGIVTLEYNEMSHMIRNAVGASMDIQTPYNNALHVFIGNTDTYDDSGIMSYKPIESNYYYKKTLFDFNYDYIKSVKLFEPKVVASQLLNQLTGAIDIDLNISYSRLLIKNETMKMVESIVESDDSVVSDCFFTFSNTDYDKMMQKAEMVHNGLFTVDGEENSAVVIDPQEIMDTLNTISDNSSKEEIQTVIEGSLTEISALISNAEYKETDKVNFGVKMNFIENLLTSLSCVITLSVLSPKIYLLILIDLKAMGQQTNFNLRDFIAMFKQLIASLVRAVRDALIQYLVSELMKLLSDLAATVASTLAVEQAAYYARLIKSLIDCFKSDGGTELDWQMDKIDHADIIQEETEPKNSEC